MIHSAWLMNCDHHDMDHTSEQRVCLMGVSDVYGAASSACNNPNGPSAPKRQLPASPVSAHCTTMAMNRRAAMITVAPQRPPRRASPSHDAPLSSTAPPTTSSTRRLPHRPRRPPATPLLRPPSCPTAPPPWPRPTAWCRNRPSPTTHRRSSQVTTSTRSTIITSTNTTASTTTNTSSSNSHHHHHHSSISRSPRSSRGSRTTSTSRLCGSVGVWARRHRLPPC